MPQLEPTSAPRPGTPAVVARNLHLDGTRGPVYRPVDFTVPPGSLNVVTAPAHCGRTSLLLTLAGRMRPSRGSELSVFGHPLPAGGAAVRRLAGIAGFRDIDEPDDSVTVGAALKERRAWSTPWWRTVPHVTDDDTEALLRPVFGDRPLPSRKTVVWSLGEIDLMLLRIAVALIPAPALLLVDDVDQITDPRSRDVVWERLAALVARGLTIVTASGSDDEPARLGWPAPPRQILLPRPDGLTVAPAVAREA